MKTGIILFLFIMVLGYAAAGVYGAPVLQTAVINGGDADLRAEPGPYGQIVSVLPKGLTVAIMEQSGRWYKVRLSDGKTGWVYRRFIEVQPAAGVKSGEQIPGFLVDKLLNYAKSFLEVRYVYGGASPQGFDCSGFTMYIFVKFGISLPHRADLQTKSGEPVSGMADLQPGDLVFFKTRNSPTVNHVGIYLGDNRFIHASSGYGAVRISPLNRGYYYNCYAGGCRLINHSRNGPDELDRL